MEIRTNLGRDGVKGLVGEDARFWNSGCQMTFFEEDSTWFVEANPAAPNDTLVNGRAVTAAVALHDGDRVAVGRESKGIEKGPLAVRLGD